MGYAYEITTHGTAKNYARGKKIAREIETIRYDGMIEGIRTNEITLPPHLMYTLNHGDGTTILVNLDAEVYEVKMKVTAKGGKITD